MMRARLANLTVFIAMVTAMWTVFIPPLAPVLLALIVMSRRLDGKTWRTSLTDVAGLFVLLAAMWGVVFCQWWLLAVTMLIVMHMTGELADMFRRQPGF